MLVMAMSVSCMASMQHSLDSLQDSLEGCVFYRLGD